jgi:hypothetical protein
MYWLAADVVEAAGVAVAVAAAACALVVAREGAAVCAAGVVIAEVAVVALAADTAALDALLQCRAHRLAHPLSIGRPHDAQALGRATVICRRLAVGPVQVSEADRVVVWPEVAPEAPVDPAPFARAQVGRVQVVVPVPVVVPAADHLRAVAAFHRIAICKTSSIFLPVFLPVAAWVAQIGHRLDPADRV